MNSKTKNWISIIFVFIIVLLSLYLIYPIKVSLSPFKITKPKTLSTKLGLDIRGGMFVVMTAKPTKENPVTEESMNQAMLIMRDRVDRLGVAEPQIERQGPKNIIVQLPGIKNPEEAIDIIHKPAYLEFIEVTGVDNKTQKVKLGKTVLTGKALASARATFTDVGAPQVEMTFNADGSKKFAEITGRLAKYPEGDQKRRLAIVLDGKVKSSPNVQQQITGGRAVITGLDSIDEAKNIALVLQTGTLPVKLEMQQNVTVGATLGRDSLISGLKAGLIGLVLVALYMLIFYRVYAILTWLNIIIFGVILWGLLIAFGATLTLPGIAAVIIMVGIAADSSIIVLERVKEEIRKGKAMRLSLEKGFEQGFKTFLDADLVTLVITLILFYFGVATIKGFALILMFGIFCDLFTAYFFKKPALQLLARLSAARKPWLLGVKAGENVEI